MGKDFGKHNYMKMQLIFTYIFKINKKPGYEMTPSELTFFYLLYLYKDTM